MKIELEVDIDELIRISQHYCDQLEQGNLRFSPVKDHSMIEKLLKTGLVESGVIENNDGYWTIGRRDGEHVLIEYKPFNS
jgi:hypothetical protein